MINLVPTTAEHINALYGKTLPITIFGVTGVEDGKVLGLGALYIENGCMVATCKIADETRPMLKRYARALFIGWRNLRAVAKSYGLSVRARADPDVPRSAALLRHLGFVQIDKDIWEN